MHELSAREQLRIEALHAAVGVAAEFPDVLQTADDYFAWLVRHEAQQVAISVTVTRPDGSVVSLQQLTQSAGEGNPPLMTAMQDIDTATITMEPEDSMGQPTGDTLTITQDDGGTPGAPGASTAGSVANITYTVADGVTTITLAPVAEGSVTLTVSDPSAPNVAPFTNVFTVSASATASLVANITVNPGANQPPAGG